MAFASTRITAIAMALGQAAGIFAARTALGEKTDTEYIRSKIHQNLYS